MTHLETKLYCALLLLRSGRALDSVNGGVFRFRLTEAEVAQVQAALDAYENAETVAALSEPEDADRRALQLAERLAGRD